MGPLLGLSKIAGRRADMVQVSASSQSAATFAPANPVLGITADPSPAVDPVARFYAEYPSLAGELPHCNQRNGATLFTLEVTCDHCSAKIPLEMIHGVLNDYAHCIEVRYVGHCPQCRRHAHNVLRLSGEEMRFIQEGKWCVATRRPWWHCLWPWPIDREW
jgi:hypothetical protein